LVALPFGGGGGGGGSVVVVMPVAASAALDDRCAPAVLDPACVNEEMIASGDSSGGALGESSAEAFA
jgi:hypothetical protein